MATYDPKNEHVFNNQLKVQSIELSTNDKSLYALTNAGADLVFLVGEAIKEVRACTVVDDSAAVIVVKAASTISVVDSVAYTAGGDRKAVKVTGLGTLFAVNDLVSLKYVLGNV